jgi:hypothetical protein
MTYECGESYDKAGVYAYYEKLLHDYEEGGAEYFRIINHSADKEVEFFVAGAEDYEWSILPSVRYQKAPIYYLLYPEHKCPYNFEDYYGEGNRCGELILTESWTVDAVASLYRAEYSHSDTTKLYIWNLQNNEYDNYSMADYTNGVVPYREEYRDSIFYGVIKSGKQLAGNNKLWLLSTRAGVFRDYLVREGKF